MTDGSLSCELVLRNCRTDFYGDEILLETGKFDAGYFGSVRDGGYTAIWLRGQLRDLADFAEAPHWNNRNAQRRAALNQIIAVGREQGVGVYLYINEPKGFLKNDPIFERYPDLRGPFNPFSENPQAATYEPAYAFCTKSGFTDRYLTGGFRDLFLACPGLAGVIMITASEILSHCYSNVDVRNLLNEDFKYREVQCPRCRASTPMETVSDVITKIHRGIRSVSETAKVVAWNWSWGMYEEPPQRQIIEGLPEDVIILCDMQRGGSKTVDGHDMIVDEYSFSYLGPSPLFTETAALTRETGRGLWAKIAVNVTHEFLVVPYLPLPFRLAKKMIAVRDAGIGGFMGCWNYGGDASTPMARLGSRILRDNTFSVDRIEPEVREIAERIYGPIRAAAAYEAWSHFDRAFEYFPFDLFLIYYGPHMHGTGFEWVFTTEEIPMPWYFKNESSRRGTKFSDWCGHFTPEEIIQFFEKLTDGWDRGIQVLSKSFAVDHPYDAIPHFDDLLNEPGAEDFHIARTVILHFLSTIAFVKFRLATLEFFREGGGHDAMRDRILRLLDDEKPRIRAMSQIIAAYPDIPYSEEAQKHLYTQADLSRKLLNMECFDFRDGQAI